MSSAALSRCDLGLVPPVLTSVVAEERAAGSDAVRVRARVEWDAFADVRLDVTLVGGAVVNLMVRVCARVCVSVCVCVCVRVCVCSCVCD